MALASVQSKQLLPKMSEHDLQSKIDELTQKLRSSDIYLLLKQTALQETKAASISGQSPVVSNAQFVADVQNRIQKSPLSKVLANQVYREVKAMSANAVCPASSLSPGGLLNTRRSQEGEPLGFIRRAQLLWEKRILKSLNTMCTELSVPLARKRGKQEQIELKTKWNEIGAGNPNLEQYRPVYAPKDFLEVVASLVNPNSAAQGEEVAGYWGIVQVNLDVKTIEQLRQEYASLAIDKCQSGLDDRYQSSHFAMERDNVVRKVVKQGYSPVCEMAARRGNPVGHRAQVWEKILGIRVDEIDRLYYAQLKQEVIQHDLMIDNIIFKDIKLTSVNDDFFFVFEDFLYQVLLIFVRDTSVLKHRNTMLANPLKAYLRGKIGNENYCVVYPPSGVIPFHGFSMYVAPLCFIYADPVKLYFVFRELYLQFFCHLHCLTSNPKGVLAVSALFESLLMSLSPNLFFHLKSIGSAPLKIAFKWLMRAFSGYLEADQLLILWDRMIAHDSTEILAIMAAGLFLYRSTNLMNVTSPAAAEAIMADLSTVKVIPVLQIILATNSTADKLK
ncbi:TBC1 domain family member 19-like [Convolutriloba macropyga]|uniref:TBC1 domain family member 19-like n=1 Tax=Convolutriloba macropyga TaxID=536237 RepID=UPI003F520384